MVERIIGSLCGRTTFKSTAKGMGSEQVTPPKWAIRRPGLRRAIHSGLARGDSQARVRPTCTTGRLGFGGSDHPAILNWGRGECERQHTKATPTSFWSPYADRLLIPQLREMAGEYGVDGAWIDGECWASVPDYGEAAIQAFQKATGVKTVPRGPGQPHWFEFLQFHRDAFREYLRHYIAEVKKTHNRVPSFAATGRSTITCRSRSAHRWTFSRATIRPTTASIRPDFQLDTWRGKANLGI